MLRGFALFGILVTHIGDFSAYNFARWYSPDDIVSTPLDAFVDVAIVFLIQDKFYSIFALLFGIGFAIQRANVTARGNYFAPYYKRRMVLLMVLGLIHGVAVWYGDILFYYAVLGFALLAFTNVSRSRLAAAIAGVLALRVAWSVLPLLMQMISDASVAEEIASARDRARTLVDTFRGNDVVAIVVANTEFWRLKVLQMAYSGKLISIFLMFLVGFYIGRFRLDLLADGVRRHGVIALLVSVALIGNGLLAYFSASVMTGDSPSSMATVLLERALRSVAAPAMAFCYVLLLLSAYRSSFGRLLQYLQYPGRMSLTTYLSHTLVLVALFYGIGIGPLPIIGSAYGIPLAATIFLVQVFVSRWWLSGHTQGPVEYLWRRMAR